MAIFRFFQDGGRLPSWICNARVWITHEEFGGLYRCTKFGWDRHSSFDNMQVLKFCELSLKKLIHAPEWFLGDFTTKWGAVSSSVSLLFVFAPIFLHCTISACFNLFLYLCLSMWWIKIIIVNIKQCVMNISEAADRRRTFTVHFSGSGTANGLVCVSVFNSNLWMK